MFHKDDFISNRGRFSEETLEKIFKVAREKYDLELRKLPTATEDQKEKVWNQVVADFHRNNLWGFAPETPEEIRARAKEQKPKKPLWEFLRPLIVTVLVTKPMVYYFGLQYSKYPGQGYGYGLALFIGFTLMSYGYLIYKFRDYQDE